jgi:hypothetical protein
MSEPGGMRQYLRNVDYPATKEEVAAAAESVGAPQGFVDLIRAAGVERFGTPDQVLEATHGSPPRGRGESR